MKVIDINTICKSVKDKFTRQHIRNKFAQEWTAAADKHGLSKAKELALEWAQYRADTYNGNHQ